MKRYTSILISILSYLNATDYFVAVSYGDDTNNGTSLLTPFKTIGKAASVMSSGDKCYIRQGRYHEAVTINNLDGQSGSAIVFTSYNSERVVLDGTTDITSTWTQMPGSNIWRTKLTSDIWQLFLNWEEQVMARWPNAKFSDGTIWDNENNWAIGTIDDDETAYSNGTIIDDPFTNSSGVSIDLNAAGFDLDESGKAAIAILNLGSFRTWSRTVISHSGNTFTYSVVPNWKTKHHYYYLEGRYEFLDQVGEWWYDTSNDSLYYYVDNNIDPNKLEFRGKVQSYAFSITGSEYIQIKDLEFFGTTVYFQGSDNCLIYGCNFMYPSCSKRMLRVVDTEPEMTKFASSCTGCTVRNSAFRNTDGTVLEMWGGTDTVDNCYFSNIDYSVADNSSIMLTVRMNGNNNVFRKNTIHKTGASATVKIGNSGLVEYNNLYDTGHLQSDGSMIQFTEAEQDGAICRYNWLHDTEKYGARFDHSGTADGTNGTMHHNVAWNCQSGGIMVKGDNHKIYNNTVLNSGSKNDIIILQIESDDHSSSIIKNNAAYKIGNHRINNVAIDFGTYSNNWNGYNESITLNSILTDTSTNDFSPLAGSALIDAGVTISNITDQYTNNGSAPDIGAYEYGNNNWTAGHDWNLSTVFGTSWVPIYSATISGSSGFRMLSSPTSGQIFSDLLNELWMQGMAGGDVTDGTANLWLLDLAGQSWNSVTNISTQSLLAGQGFLVYVYGDIDFDGNDDLPVELYVSGQTNTGDISIGSIPQNSYFLAGNPYTKTIDWDLISKTNLSSVVSIWDNTSNSWKTYNGTSGDLTDGLIAPFQAFWVQASGGTGSFIIQSDDIATSSGSFLGRSTDTDSLGHLILKFSSNSHTDNLFFTFKSDGSIGLDNHDAKKIIPFEQSSRVSVMSICETKALKINHLPFYFGDSVIIPIQILSLDIDTLNNMNLIADTLNLEIDEDHLPPQIMYRIKDTYSEHDLSIGSSIYTAEGDLLSYDSSQLLMEYPIVYDQRYSITFYYNTLGQGLNENQPSSLKLYQNYPNPFNSRTVINYEIPEPAKATLTIYDITGNEVARIFDEIRPAGLWSAVWSGKNHQGQNISSGMYIYTLKCGNLRHSHKMIIIQ